MHFYQLNWIDALLDASMILTGMGPVSIAKSNGAKIFASFYALYSGIAFLTSSLSKVKTNRKTPWAEGCCGPKLIEYGIIGRNSSNFTLQYAILNISNSILKCK